MDIDKNNNFNQYAAAIKAAKELLDIAHHHAGELADNGELSLGHRIHFTKAQGDINSMIWILSERIKMLDDEIAEENNKAIGAIL